MGRSTMDDPRERVRRRPSPLRALGHRNFRLFFAGQLVSLVGTWMQSVAQGWLVFRLTGSPVELGMVGFASQFPVFVLAPLGGVVADRHARQRALVATQTASMLLAFVLAALTLSGRVREWHIFVLASLLGVVNAFDIPIRQAFVVEMVGREDLANAIALNSSMVNGARVVGPAVAGLLVAARGRGMVLLRERRELRRGDRRPARHEGRAAAAARSRPGHAPSRRGLPVRGLDGARPCPPRPARASSASPGCRTRS